MVDPVPAMQRIVAVLGTVGFQHVYTGAPESLDTRVNVYVTLDRWVANDRLPGVVSHEVDFLITLAYRVAGAEATAETELATKAGATLAALLPERRTNLAGTVAAVGVLDFSRAAEPQYAVVAGQEFRLYPGTLRTKLQETF